jgi:hypothetical protein
MAQTTFSGPVVSQNGFQGTVVSTAAVVTALTTTGAVIMLDLPTADPHVLGRLWNNSGVVTVSAG